LFASPKLVVVPPTPPQLRERYVEVRASEELVRRMKTDGEPKPARHGDES
jgi:hypothetical protein